MRSLGTNECCRWFLAVPLALAMGLFAAGTRAVQAQSTHGSEDTSDSASTLGTHATRGVVRTLNADTLVIARSGDRGIMTFNLTPSTHREGTIVVGSTVSVRYREKGKDHIATAVALQRAKE
jgi:hypothetical protein